ncbi:DnaD domain-containing protein [Aquibacillus salsiterrae]|uniref:DnaD domain protein n=1 Tax=Aquibacillus salsiterrae TaxID=2950439 RepID=A0A9X3WHH7_9BACI|nr:DnaD domain protein [Aquibacillus salsiterrae]MDC3418698.1 DnaD domain protein [Aquibacillus salsiterrae]
MNYLKQINAFYNHLEFNPLSNNSILLWHSLMQINNKTGWMKEFTVAAKELTAKIQLNDSAFKRARDELEQKGYIRCQSRGGNLAPIYEMISLISEDLSNNNRTRDDNPIEQHNQQPNPDHVLNNNTDGVMNDKLAHKPNPLYKQEIKTKQNKNKITTTNQAELFYEENINKITPYIKGQLTDWTFTLGETLVIEAMKQAMERNHTSWKYVESILTAWDTKGVISLEQVESDNKAFQQHRQGHYYAPKYSKQEVIPDWFLERQKKQDVHPSKSFNSIDLEKRLTNYKHSKAVN